MAHRMEVARDLEAELFVLMTLGDDRAVRQTYIAGAPALRPKPPDDRAISRAGGST
jgi:guanine deaminase